MPRRMLLILCALGPWVVLGLAGCSRAGKRAQMDNQSQCDADTPAGRQCTAWLAAFNSGDRNSYQAFLQKNFPARLKDLDEEMRFRDMTGGFFFKKTTESTSTKLAALVQERTSDQFAKLLLEVQGAEPYAIVNLDVRAIPRPPEFPLPHLAEAQLLAETKKRIDADTAADRFAGAMLIAKNGKPILTEARGLADRGKKLRNRVDTRFRLGSMNKMFTAVAVLQLVQAGKLGLQDPVGKYLGDYPNQDVATKVTIHHLLTHTGGTGDIFGPDFDTHRKELRTLADYVKLYGQRGLEFEPGSRWAYSNYGFILLGVIVEKITGKSYYDYVASNVFAAAGMVSTGSDPEDKVDPKRSVGYTKDAGGTWKSNEDTLPYRGTSAGGGYSTVEDLNRFANALTHQRLLDAKHTEMLITGQADMPNGNRYGYGFAVVTANGTRCFGHGGGAPGMNGELRICPDVGYTVIALANLDPPAASRLAEFALYRLPSK